MIIEKKEEENNYNNKGNHLESWWQRTQQPDAYAQSNEGSHTTMWNRRRVLHFNIIAFILDLDQS
jgi:hypothetical protein